MALDTIIFLHVLLTLGGLCVAGLWHEHQRRQFGPMRSRDRVFRCEQCRFVYTDDADVARSRCPHCGETNEPIQF